MNTEIHGMRAPADVATGANRLVQATIGQIRRSRIGRPQRAVDLAIDALESNATRDYVKELAIRRMPGCDAAEVLRRLHRDAQAYLSDCVLRDERGDDVANARVLLAAAVDEVLRHT